MGDKVIEVEGFKKFYGECLLIDDLIFKVFKGVIVGIVGFNGVGKFMFFRMLMGLE